MVKIVFMKNLFFMDLPIKKPYIGNCSMEKTVIPSMYFLDMKNSGKKILI